MSDKLTKAIEKIRSRLESIDAALADLAALPHAHPTGPSFTKQAFKVHKNRLAPLFISICHLKDDVKGLAKLKGLDKKAIDRFIAGSPAISLCIKVANTYKHGTGGRSTNNAVMLLERQTFEQKDDKQGEDDPLIGLSMLIVDEKGKPHQSDLLAKEALRHWLPFLHYIGVDIGDFEKKWYLHSLPEGMSIYEGEYPSAFLQFIKDEANKQK